VYIAQIEKNIFNFGAVHKEIWWKKPKEKRQLGEPSCRREDNIQIDLKKI
jgi:hypothetical protein